jgi:hypothetical protein
VRRISFYFFTCTINAVMFYIVTHSAIKHDKGKVKMKHERLKKAVEKYAPIEEVLGKCNYYSARFMNRIISWHVSWYEKEDGLASLVRVRHIDDKDDFVSDYHAGSYFDTIKSAIRNFTYDLHKIN